MCSPTQGFYGPQVSGKWAWKMKWCEERNLPPADTKVWEKAEQAYLNQHTLGGVE